MQVIDVGGHIGVPSVVIAKKIGDKGRLYSFEPIPEFYSILKRNLSSNRLKNVKVYQLGVGDYTGKVDFYENAASSSIVPQEGGKKLRVDLITIDTFLNEEDIERIDFINMDCKGSEFFVLKGAEGILRNDKVKIFCEIHHPFLKELDISVQNIVKYLQKLRFQVYSISLDNLSMDTILIIVTIYMPISGNIPNTSVIYSLNQIVFVYKIEDSQSEKSLMA